MKNIIKFVLMAWVTSFALNSCLPNDDYSLGENEPVTLEQVTFTYAKTDRSDNMIQFTNTSVIKVVHSLAWNLGNGSTSNAQNPTGLYPDAGTYTVSLTVTTADGNVVVRTQSIVIAQDDPTLFDTPAYRNLTGGPDNAEGKTWVFDQYNLYTAQVKNALGKDIRGHMGLGPVGALTQEWWGAGPNEKSYDGTLASVEHGWKFYDWKLTFSMATGLKLKIETAGEGYGRGAMDGQQGFNSIWKNGDDMAFLYDGGDYTFELANAGTDAAGFPELTLSGNAFMGYYVGTQVYDIIYLTADVMALKANNSQQGQDWIFIYIREDLNKEPDVATIEADQITFEMTQGSDEFTYDYSVTVDNPKNIDYTVEVQFGDGEISTDLTGSHVYAVPKGTYTARCVLISGGKQVVKTKTVAINNTNPLYNIHENLTGGKSWRLRPPSQGSGIIMTSPDDNDAWWTVDAGAAGSEAAYDDILTFYNGGKAKLDNHGDSFMNESTGDLFSDGNTGGSFVTHEYVPSDHATWEFVENGDILNLKLTNVFPMYAVSPDVMQEGIYEVLLVTTNLLHVKYNMGWGNWHFYLVPAE